LPSPPLYASPLVVLALLAWPARALAHSPGDGHVHTSDGPLPTTNVAESAREPNNAELLEMGVALAIPDYFLGVTQHEGLHALFATAFGARVMSLRVLPGDDNQGHFRFGDTEWRGALTNEQRLFVYLAPKLGDLAGLSVFAALELTDNLPESKYVELPILVLATGMLIDFMQGITSTADYTDMGQVYDLLGARSEASRLPYRFLHGGIAIAAAVPIVRGYSRLFSRTPESPRPRRHSGIRVEPYAACDVFGVRGTF
jgi:hypothetical protein